MRVSNSFLREAGDFWRFFRKTSAEQKRIVFYAEYGGHYAHLKGLIDELTNNRRQRVCYIASSVRDPVWEESNQLLNIFYINRLMPLLMVFINCRVLVMTMPDLNTFHIKRSIRPVHYVYVFHSLVSTHMMYRKEAFNHYDSILCAGPHHIKEIREREKQAGLPEKELIEAGFYRLEKVNQEYQEFIVKGAAQDKVQTVVIAPSWGDNNIIEQFGEVLVRDLTAKGYRVIMRPHPETWKVTPNMLEEIANQFSANRLFELERSVATNESLLKADVLICDLSGVAIEYALGTERPVLFIDVPPKKKNPEYKELNIEPWEIKMRSRMGLVAAPDMINQVSFEVGKLIANQKSYRQKLARMRSEAVFNFGRSSRVGAEHIIKVLERR